VANCGEEIRARIGENIYEEKWREESSCDDVAKMAGRDGDRGGKVHC